MGNPVVSTFPNVGEECIHKKQDLSKERYVNSGYVSAFGYVVSACLRKLAKQYRLFVCVSQKRRCWLCISPAELCLHEKSCSCMRCVYTSQMTHQNVINPTQTAGRATKISGGYHRGVLITIVYQHGISACIIMISNYSDPELNLNIPRPRRTPRPVWSSLFVRKTRTVVTAGLRRRFRQRQFGHRTEGPGEPPPSPASVDRFAWA